MKKDNFLDIVAGKGRFVLAIECKKIGHEFTFLLPLGEKTFTGTVNDFRGAMVQFIRQQGRSNISYETIRIQPKSYSSEFCVIGKGSDPGRLLERDASILVRAADAFTKDTREHQKLPDEELPRVVLPVLVTNAEIYTVRYEPTQVSLNSGEYEAKPGDIERAPWVRFYKSFTAHDNLGERSVFVVNASAFQRFSRKA